MAGEIPAISVPTTAGNVGITWKGLSVDAMYTKEHGGVSSGNFVATDYAYPRAKGQLLVGSCPNALTGTITDNEAWTVAGKYVYDLGGGWKDEGPSAKVTFFGGYSHIEQTNTTALAHAGDNTIGGYQLATVNNTPFADGTSRIREISWLGAKYETGPWAFTGAYYHDAENSLSTKPYFCSGSTVRTVATGSINQLSGLVDYTVNKHFDIYAGISWSEATGGLGTGFTNIGSPARPSTTVAVTGMRLKF